MNTSKSLVKQKNRSSSRGPDCESSTGLPLLKWTICVKVKIASMKQSLGIEEVGTWISSTRSRLMIHSGFPPSQMRKQRSWALWSFGFVIDQVGHEMCLKALTCFPGFPQLSRECSFRSSCMIDLEVCLETISFVKHIKDRVGHDICLKAFWAFRVSPNSVTNDAWS